MLAFGQTGSGKTYTVVGTGDWIRGEERGMVQRMVQDVFRGLREKKEVEEVTVKMGFVEIYKEVIGDLLREKGKEGEGKKIKIRERADGNVFMDGVLEEYVTNERDVFVLMARGIKNRAMGSTKMNEHSSRSHSLMVLTVLQKFKNGTSIVSKLSFGDLAGSENVKKTGAQGKTLEEAKKINQSLSAFGNCINALSEGRQHIPYRDSKLTYLLKNSLGGNSKTAIIVTCSSDAIHTEETLASIRFAQRAMMVKNKVTINKQLSTIELQDLVNHLKKDLLRVSSHRDLFAALSVYFLSTANQLPLNIQMIADQITQLEKENPEIFAIARSRISLNATPQCQVIADFPDVAPEQKDWKLLSPLPEHSPISYTNENVSSPPQTVEYSDFGTQSPTVPEFKKVVPSHSDSIQNLSFFLENFNEESVSNYSDVEKENTISYTLELEKKLTDALEQITYEKMAASSARLREQELLIECELLRSKLKLSGDLVQRERSKTEWELTTVLEAREKNEKNFLELDSSRKMRETLDATLSENAQLQMTIVELNERMLKYANDISLVQDSLNESLEEKQRLSELADKLTRDLEESKRVILQENQNLDSNLKIQQNGGPRFTRPVSKPNNRTLSEFFSGNLSGLFQKETVLRDESTLIYSGTLKKLSDYLRTSNSRFFRLYPGELLFWKDEADAIAAPNSSRGIVSLVNVLIDGDITNFGIAAGCGIKISGPKMKSIYLETANAEQAEQWINKLLAATALAIDAK